RSAVGNVIISSADEVKMFDATGKFIRSIGRRGQGPGEFQGVFALGVAPDNRIVIIDVARHRVNVFDNSGLYISSRPYDAYIPVGGFFPDGSYLARKDDRPNPETKIPKQRA